jgi:hypothetical protein
MNIKDFIDSITKVKNKILDPRDEYINNPNYTEQTSLGGAAYNTAAGAGNFVKGLAKLPGQIITGVTNPEKGGEMLIDTAKGFGNYVNNLAGQPVTVKDGKVGLQAPSILHSAKTAYDDPFNAAVTVLSARDIVKKPSAKTTTEKSSIADKPQTTGLETKVTTEKSVNKPTYTIPDEEVTAFKNQYTVPTKRANARDLDLTGTSKEMLNHIKSGMKVNPEEAPALVTGKNGLSTRITNDIVSNTTSPIDLVDVTTAAKEVLNKNKTAINLKTRNAIISDITSGIDPGSYANGSITNMSAQDALSLARQLDDLSSQYGRQSTYLTPSVKSEVISKAFSSAADKVIENINKAVVQDGAISKIDQANIIAEANKISPLYAQQITEALADTSIPLSKVRSTAAPFVRYQKIIDMTKDSGNSSFSKLSSRISNTPGELITNPKSTLKSIVSDKINEKFVKQPEPHDFSKPFDTTSIKAKAGLPPILKKTMSLAKYSSIFSAINDSQNNGKQNQTNPIDEIPNNTQSNNIQGQSNHNGIISQQGRYTIDLPQNKGFITGDDYTNNGNQLTQQIAQANASGDTVTATKLAGQKAQLDNTWTQQAPIRETATKINTFAGLANNAYEALKNYNVSLLNLNGSFDSLMNGGDPNAAAAATALQAIKDQTGLDFSHYKTKETLMAALDTAFKQQTNLLNAQNQQFFGGNTLNAGGTTTNNNTVNSLPAIEDNSELGKPVNYNFNFGKAGQGLPARPN